jgi:multimeric flavodoxin WrbA
LKEAKAKSTGLEAEWAKLEDKALKYEVSKACTPKEGETECKLDEAT